MMDLYPLVKNILTMYLDKPNLVKDLIGKYWVQRQSLLELYEVSVYHKELEPIERLPVSEKNRLWTLAKDWCKRGVKERTETVKCIFLIESATQRKIEV